MIQSSRIAITGMGVISAIGQGVAANLAALRLSAHGIRPITLLDTAHKGKLPAGEIWLNNQELYQMLGIPSSKAYTRSTLIGLVAAREALASAGARPDDPDQTGFISATTVGGMDATERYYAEYLKSDAHIHYIPTQPCGFSTEQIAGDLGITGYTTTISTACSSAANAIMLGARLIRSRILERVVVGGTDCLSRFTINGFNSLMIYSDEPCTPFDENRKGLNLGEAAAYLVLESDKRVSAREKTPLAYLSGYGNANDAFHQTASSETGEGAYLAISKALQTAGLDPTQIDYINAHGTATANNDLSEGRALLRTFGTQGRLVPDFSSTKAFTGHTLAAAGAIEAVYAVLSLREQCIFSNLHFSTPIAELGISPVNTLKPKKIRHVLSNSLGFGGNCTSLIFTKYHA